MFDRLSEMPAYQVSESQVDAECYNLVRLSLLRHGSPLRITLPNLRSLEMHLDEDSWTVIDGSMNDLPVAAWTHFETDGRDNLHLPIACRIRHFHAHASLISEAALQEMVLGLRLQL